MKSINPEYCFKTFCIEYAITPSFDLISRSGADHGDQITWQWSKTPSQLALKQQGFALFNAPFLMFMSPKVKSICQRHFQLLQITHIGQCSTKVFLLCRNGTARIQIANMCFSSGLPSSQSFSKSINWISAV